MLDDKCPDCGQKLAPGLVRAIRDPRSPECCPSRPKAKGRMSEYSPLTSFTDEDLGLDNDAADRLLEAMFGKAVVDEFLRAEEASVNDLQRLR